MTYRSRCEGRANLRRWKRLRRSWQHWAKEYVGREFSDFATFCEYSVGRNHYEARMVLKGVYPSRAILQLARSAMFMHLPEPLSGLITARDTLAHGSAHGIADAGEL